MKYKLYLGALSLALLASTAGCSSMRSAKSRVQDTWNTISGSDKSQEARAADAKVGEGELPTADLTALQTETMINKIMFGKWNIIKVGKETVTGEDRPYIVFDSTAVNPFMLKIYAYDGCNTINGMMALTQGNEISKVGDFASTLRLCPDARYEAGISTAIDSAKKYKIDSNGKGDYRFYIYNATGDNTMILSKNDMAFVDGAWLVTNIGQIEVKESDMPSPMMLVIDLPEHKLHGSTGCNVLNGNITENPDIQNSIGFTDMITTRMGCPNAGLEQQLTAALSRVVRVEQGRKADTLLLLDTAGNTVVKLKRTTLTLDD